MPKFEKVSDTGSVPHAERTQSPSGERSPLRRPSEVWQKRAAASFSEIGYHLNVVQAGLREGQVQREFRERKARAAIAGFGRAFTEFLNDEMPDTFKKQAEYLFRSEDTLFRWRTGQSIPPRSEIADVFSKVEKITGRRVPAERQAKLLEAHKEARAVPRTLGQRYEAAEAEFTERIKRHADLADHVDEVRGKVASLERQLSAVQGSGGSNSQDTLQSGQIPDRREEEELRRLLVAAQQDLEEALKQQQENQQELRECAQKLIEAVDSYLALTSAYMSE